MTRIVRCPGVVAVECAGEFAYVRWEPAAVWRPPPQTLDGWKGQVHVVAKAALTSAVRAALWLRLPEDVVAPEQRLDAAMLRATRLVTVSESVRAGLLAAGVRVWTIGYHRVPGILRIVGVGGDGTPVWIEQDRFGCFAGALPGRPPGRPDRAPWWGWIHDPEWFDRILRAVSGGVLDEPSILLADEVARAGFGNLHADAAERRADVAYVQALAEDPLAEECGYAELRWTSLRIFEGDEDAAACPELVRDVATLAGPGGPRAVEVEEVGSFWREALPAMTMLIAAPSRADGWLPPIAEALPVSRGWALHVDASHRYARHMGSGAWLV